MYFLKSIKYWTKKGAMAPFFVQYFMLLMDVFHLFEGI